MKVLLFFLLCMCVDVYASQPAERGLLFNTKRDVVTVTMLKGRSRTSRSISAIIQHSSSTSGLIFTRF